MANKKITELQLVDAITDDLNFPVDDTLQTYRATIGQVKTYLDPIYIPPSQQKFTSGSGTYNLGHAFIVSGANATVGATYTNNGNTYTVTRTVASSNLVWLAGSAAPTASGTLTKSGGTGDATIAFSAVRKAKYIKVFGVGGGGGGGGSGSSGGDGTSGASTTFGSSLLTATGGAYGQAGSPGGDGGTATINSPAEGIGTDGALGTAGGLTLTTGSVLLCGGPGGASRLGGNGGGGGPSQGGYNAKTNSGSGGGGGGTSANAGLNLRGGGGGGAGACFDALIYSPSYTYAYGVGAAGSGGSAGTNGGTGGNGSAGLILVEEHYQ